MMRLVRGEVRDESRRVRFEAFDATAIRRRIFDQRSDRFGK